MRTHTTISYAGDADDVANLSRVAESKGITVGQLAANAIKFFYAKELKIAATNRANERASAVASPRRATINGQG